MVDLNLDRRRVQFKKGKLTSFSDKGMYLLEGDKLEAKVDDFIVDIARGDMSIEIQTANLPIKPKPMCLLKDHKVRIVYPISKENG